jgi:predicted N-acyltransferase
MRVEDNIGNLPEAEWQHLVYERPSLRIEVLKAIVATADNSVPLLVFLLEDDVGIAAAAICEQRVRRRVPGVLDSLLYGRAAHVAGWLGASTRPAFNFRTPLGSESAVILRQASPTRQRQVLCVLLDGIEAEAARRNFGVAFVGVTADDRLVRATLRERGYLDTEIQPTTRMVIEWVDFDGYLRYLQSHSRNAARAARKERSRNRREGVIIRRVKCTVANAQALYDVAREHCRYKNGHDPLYAREFLPQLSQSLPDDFLIFEATRDGRRVGMLGVVRSGSVGWMAWYGMEPYDRPNDFTYASMNFYHMADSASALGLKNLLYGPTALDAKRRRGCQVVTSHLFYRPRRAPLRVIAKPYFWLHRAWYRRKLQ